MIVGLAHVCIETADLEATENFYALLGAKRQFELEVSDVQQVYAQLSENDIEATEPKLESDDTLSTSPAGRSSGGGP